MYTTHLTAGQGMLDETDRLLQLWQQGMNANELGSLALEHGIFPAMSARRIKNVVSDCFAPRYLSNNGRPAEVLKKLSSKLQPLQWRQLQFVYTCRANEILADFVTEVYWGCYAAGKSNITKDDAIEFVTRSSQDGKTAKLWSEGTINRISGDLMGCCADFGLLAPIERSSKQRGDRPIIKYRVHPSIALILCHELHFQPMGDNSVVGHPDWQLFGLGKSEVIEELRSLSLGGHFLVQSAGGVASISWKYGNIQEVIDVIH